MKELRKDELSSIIGGKSLVSFKIAQPNLKNQDMKIHSSAGTSTYTFIWG